MKKIALAIAAASGFENVQFDIVRCSAAFRPADSTKSVCNSEAGEKGSKAETKRETQCERNSFIRTTDDSMSIR